MWAVELRADGLDLALSADTGAALLETRRTKTRQFTYEPSTTLPEHWHPYRIETRAGPCPAGVRPGARRRPAVRFRPSRAPVRGPNCIGAGAGHALAASAVPNQGLRLERRYTLARGTDGRPVLWRQRRRLPVLAGPVSHLRFDLLKEEPAP